MQSGMLLTVSTIVPAIIVNICCIVTDMFANVVEYDVVISFSHIMYTHICILCIYIYIQIKYVNRYIHSGYPNMTIIWDVGNLPPLPGLQ